MAFLCFNFILFLLFIYQCRASCDDTAQSVPFVPMPTDHPDDVSALVDLFFAMKGSAIWTECSNWLVNGTSICSWFGVLSCDCSSSLCRVQTLDLYANTFIEAGQFLPDSIGNLTALTTLNLAQNSLTSTLPSTIGNLVNLQILDISFNKFNGTLPDSLSRCTQLTDIVLNTNGFTQFPQSLSNLSSLLRFDASWNVNLVKPFVFSKCPPNLRYFRQLSMEFSQLRHSSEFLWMCDCPFMLELEVSGLTGPFPDFLGRCLSSLRKMIFKYNSMTGELPRSLCLLNQLLDVHISFSSLGGQVPDCIGDIRGLKILDLEYNSFLSTIPPSIGLLQNLSTLNLHQNNFFGTLPSSMSSMVLLETLYIDHNNMSGTLDIISNLPSMRSLSGSFNSFTGHLPRNLSKYTEIYLSSNQLIGTMPEDMFWSTSALLRIDISNNFCTGTLPQTIHSTISYLYLQQNQFSGTIPDWICNPGQLMTIINLAQNLLSGTIPSCSYYGPNLAALNISLNRLNGTIPESLGNINNQLLYSLDLHSNFLTGSVPISFQNLTLQYLDLSRNLFSGTFQAPLRQAKSLSRLDLSSNRFSGSLDDIFHDSNTLPSYLNISHNRFSGLVTTLAAQCNHSNTPACPSVAILDARGNQFDCPFPQYSQLDTLFLRDACSPPYTTFAIYSGSLVGALLLLLLVRYFVLRQFGSASSSLVTPSYAPSRWKWLWHVVVYVLSLVTLGSDVYTMYTIGEYLLSRIDNCSLVNAFAVWKSLSAFMDSYVVDEPKYQGISFSNFVLSYIGDLSFNSYGIRLSSLSAFDMVNTDLMQTNVRQFSEVCLAIQSGCALRPPLQFTSNLATECFMAFDDQAPFGGTSHRLFAYICIAIVAVRALVELGKASVVLWSWLQGRIVGARWSIDFVGASLLSPMFVLSLGGDWSEYFKVVVSHEASYSSLAWRVVHQSMLCSVPLLCANLYFLFSVSQSGLQLLNMFSVLSACVSIPLTIVRAVLAWRSLDASYSTSEVAQVLEFTQNVVDIGKVDM